MNPMQGGAYLAEIVEQRNQALDQCARYAVAIAGLNNDVHVARQTVTSLEVRVRDHEGCANRVADKLREIALVVTDELAAAHLRSLAQELAPSEPAAPDTND